MDIFSCPVAYVYTPVMEALAEAGGGKPPPFCSTYSEGKKKDDRNKRNS